MNDAQSARVAKDWSDLAGENVTVENIKGTYYAFGSEVACLRLAYKFRRCGDRVAFGFSENMKTWYFRMEPRFN